MKERPALKQRLHFWFGLWGLLVTLSTGSMIAWVGCRRTIRGLNDTTRSWLAAWTWVSLPMMFVVGLVYSLVDITRN